MSPPIVGQELEAWCNPCGMVLAHVVVAMKGTRAHRVECKTCKAVHAYRKSPPKKRKSSPKTPRKSNYDKQMEGRDLSNPTPYDTQAEFRPEDIVLHPKFGVGLVAALLDAGTMEVVFPDRRRRLIFNRQ